MRPVAPTRKPLPTGSTGNAEVDQHLREHRDAVEALRASPAVNARTISGVSLADGVETPVRHLLGTRPSIVLVSVTGDPTSTGRVTVISRDATYATLKATGWTSTIVVDVKVEP